MGRWTCIQVVLPPVARLVGVMWASVDGAACGGVAEGGVGDALGVDAGVAGSVVGDVLDVSACCVREGAPGYTIVDVVLVATTVWALWVVVPAVSSRLGGHGYGPSPLLAEGLLGISAWLVCRSRWCLSPLVSGHAPANHGRGRQYCRCR